MEITGVDSKNTGVIVEITGVSTKTPRVQDTPHGGKNNECEDGEMSETADEYIPEEDVHHPNITSQTEWRI